MVLNGMFSAWIEKNLGSFFKCSPLGWVTGYDTLQIEWNTTKLRVDYIFGIHYATINETNSMNARFFFHSMAPSDLQLLVKNRQKKRQETNKICPLVGDIYWVSISMFDSNNSGQLGISILTPELLWALNAHGNFTKLDPNQHAMSFILDIYCRVLSDSTLNVKSKFPSWIDHGLDQCGYDMWQFSSRKQLVCAEPAGSTLQQYMIWYSASCLL
jgi:hypothetical protein